MFRAWASGFGGLGHKEKGLGDCVWGGFSPVKALEHGWDVQT